VSYERRPMKHAKQSTLFTLLVTAEHKIPFLRKRVGDDNTENMSAVLGSAVGYMSQLCVTMHSENKIHRVLRFKQILFIQSGWAEGGGGKKGTLRKKICQVPARTPAK